MACGSSNNHGRLRTYLGFTERGGEVRVFSFPALKEISIRTAASVAQACVFSSDGKHLAASFSPQPPDRDDAKIFVWSFPDMTVEREIAAPDWESPLAFSATGAVLAYTYPSPQEQTKRLLTLLSLDKKSPAETTVLLGPSVGTTPVLRLQNHWRGHLLYFCTMPTARSE